MPLGVQICIQKPNRNKRKKLLSNTHYGIFPPGPIFICSSCFPSVINHTRRFMHEDLCMCVSLWVGVCWWIAGQMQTLRGNLGCCGAKGFFLFTPLVVCLWGVYACEMQVRPVADKHHHAEWYTSWMLNVWQQHIIILLEARTEWSLQPPPLPAAMCSALIYTLKSAVIWSLCLGNKSEINTTPCKSLSFHQYNALFFPAGYVYGWIWCCGPGAWNTGFSGDQHIWEWWPTWEWRGIYEYLILVSY